MRKFPGRFAVAALAGVALAAGCGAGTPVAYPERHAAWQGSRKQTIETAEEAVRDAMAGVEKVPAPGNEQAVVDGCVNSAWFTVAGPPAARLGEGYQYQWQVCVGDDQTVKVAVGCLEVKKGEGTVDSHQCPDPLIAKPVASKTDALVKKLGGK